MTHQQLEEYKALRNTILQRGTTRFWAFNVGLLGWSALSIATAALAELPVATLLPLLFLAAVFEVVFALHIGVERIGRYVQVYLEEEPGWEAAAMGFGAPSRGAALDPLFTLFFVLAAALNIVPALLAQPTAQELGVVGAAHVIVIARVFIARIVAKKQRPIELERFRQLKASSAGRTQT